MKVVAALFDSDADATQAMDRLLREHLKDADTKVVGPGSGSAMEGQDVLPVIPNTSGGPAGSGAAPMPMGAGRMRDDWLDDLDKVESVFYQEGLREGATLVLAKVHDEDVIHARQLLSQFGARTYEKK